MKLSERTRKIIIIIGNNSYFEREQTISDVRKVAETTISHTQKIIYELEKNGFITREERGRRKPITLTKEGKKAYHCLRILNEVGLE